MKSLAGLLIALIAMRCAIAQDRASDPRFRVLDKNRDGNVSREEAGNPPWFDRLDRDGDGVITPAELPARLRAQTTAPAAERSLIDQHLGVAYGSSPLQRLDIYAPKQAKSLPVMIYIHGGGWHRGDKSAVGQKPDYFTGRGYVFVSLNYRFVPNVDILRQLQDSADAIAWVQEHISQYGGDGARLHLIGHSAGAHHVAILATSGRFLKTAGSDLSVLKSVVELDTQALDVPKLMKGTASVIHRQAFGADPDVWKAISPRHQVTEGKDIPPFFLVVADNHATKLDQSAAFQEVLRSAGVRCELVDAPQHDHGSVNRSIGDPNDKVTQAMQRFHDSITNAEESSTSKKNRPDGT